MVLCYGHIIVIDYNNQVATKLCSIIQSFQCLSATQRSVSDDCDHIPFFAFQVSSLCKSAGKADRSRGMTYRKEIVFTFTRIGISRYIIIMFFIQIGIFSSRQHLMWIALV